MLEQEYEVKEYYDQTEQKLDDIEWHLANFYDNDLLGKRSGASNEVSGHVHNAPPYCWLPFPVQVDLWHVLAESDHYLDIAPQSDGCPVLANHLRLCHFNAKNSHHGKDLEQEYAQDDRVD